MDYENTIEDINIYDLKQRKRQAKILMKEYISSKEKKENFLDKIMERDNTIPEIYFYKLQTSKVAKLKERSFDILTKDQLKTFKISKAINYRELYFWIIEYIESIKLDEPENAEEDFDLEEFIGSENEEDKVSRKEEEEESDELSNNKIEQEEKEIIENQKEKENRIVLKVDMKKKMI